MPEFMKPVRKSVKVSDGFAELLGKELLMGNNLLFADAPIWVATSFCYVRRISYARS